MKKLLGLMVAVLLAFMGSAWAEDVSIDGATANAGLVKALADGFSKENPKAVINNAMPGVGNSGGIKGCQAGKFTLGRIGRPLKADEKQGGLNEVIFAKIPMAFIINPAAEITNLTSQQICDIYSGKIQNWKDVGGPDMKVYVVTRNPDAATVSTIKEKVPGFNDITITEKALVKMSDSELIDAVEKKEGTIGFCVPSNMKGQKVSAIFVDNMYFTDVNYPVMATVGLVYMNALSGTAKDFVDYIYSPAGETIIKGMKSFPIKR